MLIGGRHVSVPKPGGYRCRCRRRCRGRRRCHRFPGGRRADNEGGKTGVRWSAERPLRRGHPGTSSAPRRGASN